MVGWLMSGELEEIWKKAIVPYFKVPSLHFPRGTEEDHDNCQNSGVPSRIRIGRYPNTIQKRYRLGRWGEYLDLKWGK
jgi:hypothetical protein